MAKANLNTLAPCSAIKDRRMDIMGKPIAHRMGKNGNKDWDEGEPLE